MRLRDERRRDDRTGDTDATQALPGARRRAKARWRASWASAATRFIGGFARAISIAISTTSRSATGRGRRCRPSSIPTRRSSRRGWRRIRSSRRCGCSTRSARPGYTGGYSQLKAFVRQVRPTPPPEPVVRFETPAGRQAQVDFARFRFPWGVRYALLVVLGYSRLLWCRFYPRQDMRTLIDGLEDAFLSFGGVPQELLFDQMKAVITRDLRLEGGALIRNLEFLRFAAPLGLHAARVPPVSRADQRQSRAPGPLSARQFRLRPHVPARCAISISSASTGSSAWRMCAVHGTTRERAARPLRPRRALRCCSRSPPRRYTSLVLDGASRVDAAPSAPRPVVAVEKRSLAAYAQLAGGAA